MGDSTSPSSSHPLSQRPTYSREQLSKYIASIFSPSYTLEQLEADIKADPLSALARIQLHQLARVPWGNVGLHYSMHKLLSLDTDALFTKIVERSLGGYCMENNIFFFTVLRSLGYQLYSAGARISNAVDINHSNPDGFGGWSHMVLLASINGETYLVDVGFGSMAAVSPVLLKEGATSAGVPGNMCRLDKRAIAQNTTGQKMWILEFKNDTSNEWRPGYCFAELEFLPQDFKVINYRVHRDPTSWFTYRFVITRVLLEGEEDGNPNASGERAIGTVTIMNNSINKRIGGGRSGVIQEFKSERERVKALEQWFGVKLLAEEVNGVLGTVTEIRPPMGGI